MRLKTLYIENYKNIVKQTFDFSNNSGYIALIGENGSGKTNLLEAISLIFNGIFNKKKIPFKYELKYEHNGHLYERRPLVAMVDGIKVKDSEMLYPTSVIACYSGEDLRLWHNAYEDYYLHYFNKAIKESFYIPKLVYINKYCWEIALISLLCAFDKNDVHEFLSSCLNIKDINDVNISFYFDENKEEMFKKHDAMNWFRRLINEGGKNVNARTLSTMDIFSSSLSTQKQDKCKTIFQYLYLLSQPKRNDVNRVDKLITKISLKIGEISFEDLSEGEKKMILVECIDKVLGDQNSLVLLDEPDAHTHIARKADILETIKSFEGQTILTTHSPIFTNMMVSGNIYPIENGKAISAKQRELIVKMANNNINYIDGACIIASKYIIITEGPDDIYHIKKAISAFLSKGEQYKELAKASFLFMGGAKEVDNYYNEILDSLYDTINKIVFAFDYDEEGREGAKMVQKLIDNGHDKLAYVYYHKTYPVPAPDIDFYLEDFFERAAYNDVQIPIFNGVPSFAELKKAATWAGSIKKRIQRHKRDNTLMSNDYYGFGNFLDQLIISFKL